MSLVFLCGTSKQLCFQEGPGRGDEVEDGAGCVPPRDGCRFPWCRESRVASRAGAGHSPHLTLLSGGKLRVRGLLWEQGLHDATEGSLRPRWNRRGMDGAAPCPWWAGSGLIGMSWPRGQPAGDLGAVMRQGTASCSSYCKYTQRDGDS